MGNFNTLHYTLYSSIIGIISRPVYTTKIMCIEFKSIHIKACLHECKLNNALKVNPVNSHSSTSTHNAPRNCNPQEGKIGSSSIYATVTL